jgi:hypothetical protein
MMGTSGESRRYGCQSRIEQAVIRIAITLPHDDRRRVKVHVTRAMHNSITTAD